jgi:hypothetical protein
MKWTKRTLSVLFSLVGLALSASLSASFASDNLNHWIVVWVITTSTQVPDQLPGDVYHPEKPAPVGQKKTHEEKNRVVCAKEFAIEKDADKFINDAPPDIKPHMYKLSEDK